MRCAEVRVSGLSPDTTATGLFRQLDLWGLGGDGAVAAVEDAKLGNQFHP